MKTKQSGRMGPDPGSFELPREFDIIINNGSGNIAMLHFQLVRTDRGTA